MQEIINRYDTQGSPYLLPIIRDMEVDGRKQYKKTAHLVNQKLKNLGMRLGLSIPLTTYVARHAWASIAKSKNISLSVISEAMGHDTENTTRIYLASLDTSLVDKANRLNLKTLLSIDNLPYSHETVNRKYVSKDMYDLLLFFLHIKTFLK